MRVFCTVCKRWVELGEVNDADSRTDAMRRFRAFGHDDSPWPLRGLRRGLVGWYITDREIDMLAEVPADVVECFENRAPRVDAERLAA